MTEVKKEDIHSNGRRESIVGENSSTIRNVLKERDIAKDAKAASNDIPMVIISAKEDTSSRSMTKFGPLMRRKQNEIDTTKNTEVGVGLGDKIETFIGRNT